MQVEVFVSGFENVMFELFQCENLEAKNEMLVKASEEHEQIRNDQKLAQREIQKRADEIEQLEKVSSASSC